MPKGSQRNLDGPSPRDIRVPIVDRVIGAVPRPSDGLTDSVGVDGRDRQFLAVADEIEACSLAGLKRDLPLIGLSCDDRARHRNALLQLAEGRVGGGRRWTCHRDEPAKAHEEGTERSPTDRSSDRHNAPVRGSGVHQRAPQIDQIDQTQIDQRRYVGQRRSRSLCSLGCTPREVARLKLRFRDSQVLAPEHSQDHDSLSSQSLQQIPGGPVRVGVLVVDEHDDHGVAIGHDCQQ